MKPQSRLAALAAVAWFVFVNLLFFWDRFHHSSVIAGIFGR
jgi:hypothetical protein